MFDWSQNASYHAPCPVLVIQSEKELRNVLITLDGSQLAEAALTPGLALAARLNAKVTLLQAVPAANSYEVLRLDAIDPGSGQHWQATLLQEAQSYLKKVAAAHAQAGLQITSAVTHTPAANGILSYAEAHDMDMVVMSTHGWTGLRRWIYGSVAEKVLRSGCCTALVIRPQDAG